MKNMIDYNKVISNALIAEDEADQNWAWYLVNINENKAIFRWGYLDYLEDERNFKIRFQDYSDEENKDFGIIVYIPSGSDVLVLVGNNFWDDCTTIEEGLKIGIHLACTYAKQIF